MTICKSTRAAFGEAILDLANNNVDLVAVSADTSKSMGVNLLKEKFPEKCFDCGIAEQNMMMIAAGFAATGRLAFAVSYSMFTSTRALEQLRTFICYPNLNVKVAAGLGGFSAGIEGVTHMALEDLGIVRCIPNLVVLNPADYYSVKKVVYEASKINNPCYIRLGRDPSPVIFNDNYSFKIGRASTLIEEGNDIGIISSGIILSEVLLAVEELRKKNVGITLIEMPTLKPIDKPRIIELAKSSEIIITIEEHNIIGGLYSAVCEVLSSSYPKYIYPLAVPDIFTESGLPGELKEKYGLNSYMIAKKILSILEERKKNKKEQFLNKL